MCESANMLRLMAIGFARQCWKLSCATTYQRPKAALRTDRPAFPQTVLGATHPPPPKGE